MRYFYQLIFLGNVKDRYYGELRKCFLRRLKDLGIDVKCVKIINAGNFKKDYDNKQPSFVFFLGNRADTHKDNELLEILLNNGESIYPLYFGRNGFEQEIPAALHALNGHRYDKKNVDKYVNCALETLRLLRKTRKVFISYKRVESAAVANQLFDVLTRCNFDVFLDSYVIRGADNFQDELFHRMSDCDVVVQLHTFDFKNSEWCRAEVEMANMKQIKNTGHISCFVFFHGKPFMPHVSYFMSSSNASSTAFCEKYRLIKTGPASDIFLSLS